MKPFAAQAWPHGAEALFRLPHGHAFVQLERRGAAAAAAGSDIVLQALTHIAEVPLSVPAGSDAAGGEVMQCISTKTWRRLKMKKHKIRKRRRLVRHQGKK
ncbi:hypothetical protein HYH02_002337 [Chlamydomonas schloesseri]|uniref:Ribosomal protein mS38 C-terminal domain-containing protein n=1 Tax=Chlamydomonas schloesseri TaxID=2026947 RepID=A0A835WUK4_9CHLO|nr:hypothetical protein HYH02_002337 [Chlamydomonas schloesseri]|eukprot:KAG2453001.1 hypothetical protein HYH02_002337 [Chlamydomonas schloesseri]